MKRKMQGLVAAAAVAFVLFGAVGSASAEEVKNCRTIDKGTEKQQFVCKGDLQPTPA
jgi:hypothetical protein